MHGIKLDLFLYAKRRYICWFICRICTIMKHSIGLNILVMNYVIQLDCIYNSFIMDPQILLVQLTWLKGDICRIYDNLNVNLHNRIMDFNKSGCVDRTFITELYKSWNT